MHLNVPLSEAAIEPHPASPIESHVEIPTDSGRMPAFHARPGDGMPFASVMVLHDIFGVDEHIRDVCRRLASAGYLAVAPDLFFRHGDVQSIPDAGQILSRIVSKVQDSQVTLDLDATARWTRAEGDKDRLAIAGFGWGGRIVWLYAAQRKQVKAGAAWYGKLAGNRTADPLGAASRLKAPVIGFYGGKDAGIPLSTVEKMRSVIQPASQIVVYPDADHAFDADDRHTYNERAAQDSWRRTLDFFTEHLK